MANLAAANMMHRKTRTAVSVLAVAIEVAMVMILVGLADGTLNDIAQRLENVGADVLFQPPDASLILGVTTAAMPVKYMDLIREVEGVTDVTPVLNWHVSQINGQTKAVNMWAVDYKSFESISGGLEIVEGRPLQQPNDLVVDTMLSETTGLKVGDTLPLINAQFKIAGIFKAGAGGRLYARIEDIQQATGSLGKASFFLIKGRGAQDAEPLAKRLLEKFKGHKITPMAQVSRLMRENTVGLREFKQALTGMAVIISFMVVLLAMYTAIIERTREIGILRAIGATQSKVVQFVISESLLICMAGVAVGILFAFAGRWCVIRIFPTQAVELTQEWAIIAAALGVAGGILGSLYPAVKAARMDPVQALNFE